VGRAYYNENDAGAAAWLRELISADLIAPGVVDDRSIADVRPSELIGFDQCHFFAGIGGWSLALRLAGWPDDRPVWTGSCPCQPFSAAGRRRGFADDRHLWPFLRTLVAERRPPILLGEQVATAADWLRLVRGDLVALGYAVGAMAIEAASAGADHLRDRYWFVGYADSAGLAVGSIAEVERGNLRDQGPPAGAAADADGIGARDAGEALRARQPGPRSVGAVPDDARDGRARQRLYAPPGRSGHDARGRDLRGVDAGYAIVTGADGKARRVSAGVRLLVDGFPERVGVLRGFGNAIDPRPAAAFIRAAGEAIGDLTP
jgi:DNA (cytosine-5)-methyltransferase 1